MVVQLILMMRAEGGPYIQKFSSLSNGEVDVLVHEVTLYAYTIKPGKPSEGASGSHTTPPRVVENANALNAKVLALTHLLPSPTRPDSMGPVPNAPYRTVDDYAYSMEYEGYNNEVIVADDLTAIFLGTGVDQRGYEVHLTNGSEKFNKVPPSDYVSFRELVGDTPSPSSKPTPMPSSAKSKGKSSKAKTLKRKHRNTFE